MGVLSISFCVMAFYSSEILDNRASAYGLGHTAIKGYCLLAVIRLLVAGRDGAVS